MGLPATVHSVDLFPLVVPDARVEGLILILDSTLKPDDVQILEAFCAQTSLVLHNRLLQHRLQEAAKRDSAMSRIAQELGSTLDTDQLFDLILERLVSLVDAEKGSLMLLDEQEGSLAVKAVRGLNMKLLESVRVAPHQGISGKVLATGASLLVSDLETDERVAQKQRPRYRTKSFISLPLKLNHRTIGVESRIRIKPSTRASGTTNGNKSTECTVAGNPILRISRVSSVRRCRRSARTLFRR